MKRNAGWLWIPVLLCVFSITGAVAAVVAEDDVGDESRPAECDYRDAYSAYMSKDYDTALNHVDLAERSGYRIEDTMYLRASIYMQMGRLDLTHEMIKVTSRGTHQFNRSIDLGNGFHLGFADFRVPRDEPKSGFGLTLDKDGMSGFSWDWFHCVDDGTAYKIQGRGTIAFTTVTKDEYWGYDFMEFKEPTVLRCYKKGILETIRTMLDDDWIQKPLYTCEIEQGSFVYWVSEPGRSAK